jgi:hypothetical protein
MDFASVPALEALPRQGLPRFSLGLLDSAYQIEGADADGRAESIWDRLQCARPYPRRLERCDGL